MVDLSQYCVAKSDQLNADDLIGGPITIRVTAVKGMSDKEQPIAIYFDGDNGKPYKPGKSMRRVLVNFWGKDGEAYVGRSMTLYRDPEVTFGKLKVGGIRISHMSDLGEESEMALAVTKGAKRAFRVRPLRVEGSANGPTRTRKTPAEQADAWIAAIAAIETLDALREYQLDERRAKWLEALDPDIKARVVEANSRRAAELAPTDGDDVDDGGDLIHAAAATDDDDDGFPS